MREKDVTEDASRRFLFIFFTRREKGTVKVTLIDSNGSGGSDKSTEPR